MAFRRKQAFRSGRRKTRTDVRRALVSGVFAFSLLVVSLSIAYLTRLPKVTITTVSVSGGTTVAPESVRAKVDSTLQGTYALLIPRRFSYLYPKDEIIAAVNAIPRVHSASVVRASRQELQVTFKEYLPYALWCDSFERTAAGAPSCLFVDAAGYAYAEAPALSGETLLRFVVEDRAPKIGEHVHDPQDLEHLAALADAIRERHGERLLGITATKDHDLTLHLSGGTSILMTTETEADEAFTVIESLLAAPEFGGLKLEDFEYIDLRFGDKVYVKKRGADTEGAVEAATEEI